MPRTSRVGDPNTAGGINIGPGAPTVLINGRPAATPGNRVTPHPCCPKRGCAIHCKAVTTLGSSSVTVEGQPLVYTGSPDTCFHTRAVGSSDVIVGV